MEGWFAENPWLWWTLLAAAFLVVEACTTALVSLWFVAGAVAAAITAVFTDRLLVQIAVFLIVSIGTLVLSRKIFKRDRKEVLPEENERILGRVGVATEDITPLEGRVRIGDVYWRAVSDEAIPVDAPVEVSAVNGNILTVKPYQKVSVEK